MDNVKEKFGTSLDNVQETFSNGLSNVWETLKSLWETVKDILGNIKSGFSNVVDSVGNGTKNVVDNIIDIPNKFKELLKELFVPTVNPLNECKDKIENKFKVLLQIKDIATSMFNDFSDSSAPTFNVTYKGQTHSIINFDFYGQYRDFIHTIMIGIMWVYFVIWLLRFAPKMIKGGGA